MLREGTLLAEKGSTVVGAIFTMNLIGHMLDSESWAEQVPLTGAKREHPTRACRGGGGRAPPRDWDPKLGSPKSFGGF